MQDNNTSTNAEHHNQTKTDSSTSWWIASVWHQINLLSHLMQTALRFSHDRTKVMSHSRATGHSKVIMVAVGGAHFFSHQITSHSWRSNHRALGFLLILRWSSGCQVRDSQQTLLEAAIGHISLLAVDRWVQWTVLNRGVGLHMDVLGDCNGPYQSWIKLFCFIFQYGIPKC